MTVSVGRSVAPMFLSDFEDAFYCVVASVKHGQVTAVRRSWGSRWEVYRVAEESIEDEAYAQPQGADDAKHAHSLANVPDQPRAEREGDGQRRRWSHESRAQAPVRRRTQLEYIAFSYSSRCRPAAADTLARRLRRLHGQTPMESQMGGRDCTKGGDDAEQARNTGARRRHAPMENPTEQPFAAEDGWGLS